MATTSETERAVRIWDVPTRAFHWLLAVLILAAYLTQEFGELDRHMTIGYVILTLIVFRVLWGIVGSEPSRFWSFFPTPGRVWRYLGTLLRGRPLKVAGHNPLGSILIFVMLALVALQAGTGLFANDDIFTEGPLAKLVTSETSSYLTDIHKTVFWILLGCVVVHVFANFSYEVVFRQPVIQAMLTGFKPLPATIAEPRMRPLWLAALTLALAGFTVWYVVTQV